MTAIDAKALRKEMDRAGVRPKEFAVDLGISLSYLCDIQAGRRRLERNPVLIRRIADSLDCRVSTILLGSDAA